MIYSTHQPCYFPWLGLLSKIASSNSVILLNDVQLADRAFQHRNQFLTKEGKVKYLTIPCVKQHYRQFPLKELKIANADWGKEHHHFLLNNYQKHPFFDEIFPEVIPIFSMQSTYLADIILGSMNTSMSLFGISTPFILQSELQYDRSAKKGELILQLLKSVQATTYLSGTGAKAYQDESRFEKEGIQLNYAQFSHPVYPQKNSATFIAGLSCLDLLFNVGMAEARRIFLPSPAAELKITHNFQSCHPRMPLSGIQ